jgi:hypothetical protein
MKKSLHEELPARVSNEPNDESVRESAEGDMSQGSEYLDDAIRMVEQPLKTLGQNIRD